MASWSKSALGDSVGYRDESCPLMKDNLFANKLCEQKKIKNEAWSFGDNRSLLNLQTKLRDRLKFYTREMRPRLSGVNFVKEFDFAPTQATKLLQQQLTNCRNISGNLHTQTQGPRYVVASGARNFGPSKLISNFNKNQQPRYKEIVNVNNTDDAWYSELDLTTSQKQALVVCQIQLKKTCFLDKSGYDRLWLGLLENIKQNLDADPQGDLCAELSVRWTGLLQILYGANKDLCLAVYWASKKRDYILRTGMNKDIMAWAKKVISRDDYL